MKIRSLAVSLLLVCWWPAASAFAQPFALAVRSTVDDQLYRINLATGAASPIGATGLADISTLALHPHTGALYAVDEVLGNADRLVILSPITGAARVVGPLDFALSPVDDEGLTFDGAGNLFLSTDFDVGAIRPPLAFRLHPAPVVSLGTALLLGVVGGLQDNPVATGLTWRDGIIYGLGGHGNNHLLALNPVTGWSRRIGPLGTVTVSHGGLDFDRDGALWGLNDAGVIFRINPLTGAATVGANTLTGFESLHVIKPVPVITAPGAGGVRTSSGVSTRTAMEPLTPSPPISWRTIPASPAACGSRAATWTRTGSPISSRRRGLPARRSFGSSAARPARRCWASWPTTARSSVASTWPAGM